MNIRKHKQAYLTGALLVMSVAILWLLIAVTSSYTIPTNTKLKSGIEGSAVVVGDCSSAGKKTACPSKRTAASVVITNTKGKSTSLKTDTSGYFTVKLAPGSYTAAATGAGALRAPTQQVTVLANKFTRITFDFAR